MEKASNSSARQLFAASRITSLVREEIGRELIYLHFVPYAVSLSLSISYKQMRHAKIPIYRQRARSDLQSTCDLLDHLSNYFYLASVMANMGKATIAEMGRVSETIRRERNLIEDQPSQQSQESNADQPVASDVPENVVEHGNMELADFNLADVDIFDMFDPNFRLENVDALFQSGLDLCTPIYPPTHAGYLPRLM